MISGMYIGFYRCLRLLLDFSIDQANETALKMLDNEIYKNKPDCIEMFELLRSELIIKEKEKN